MASLKLATFLNFLLFCILINNGTTRKCYSCTSKNTSYFKCYQTDELTTESSIECGTAPCLKLKPITEGGGSENIERGCYKEELCTDYSVCYVCDNEDYCNSSVKVTSSYSIFIISLLYLYYYY